MAIILLLIFNLEAYAQSFSRGNQFNSHNVEAKVQVRCPVDVVEYRCRDNVLDPVPYDFFIAPVGSIADSLELNVRYSDGSVRTRTVAFDSSIGRSELINLWMKNSVQRPLLREGMNVIDWVILSRGAKINSGIMNVPVTKGQLRACPAEIINSQNPDDCRSQFSFCQTFLESRNYCR